MKTGIALGSNVEPRLLHLQSARRRVLALHEGRGPASTSKVYESSPVDCPEGSPGFLNAVIEIDSTLEASTLLRRLQGIEIELGRPGDHGRHTPRTIDLDLLYQADRMVNTEALILPHPRIADRRFVLQPLADIRPGLVLPGHEKSVLTMLRGLDSDESVVEFCGAVY